MKKNMRIAVTALAGVMTFGMSVVPAMAQDVTLIGPPVVLLVTAGTASGVDEAWVEAADDAAAYVVEKEVESFRIFGQTQDGQMLIRTDDGDEYVSKDDLLVLLPELQLDGFPLVEETMELGQGMNGEEVVMLQQILADLGYLEGGIDGSYGGGTAEAVSRFQTDRGLEATGNADKYTMLLIKAIANGVEENVEISSKGFESPEEKFPEIVENTDVDLEAFMEPKWRYHFEEETQSGVIDPVITIGGFAIEAPAIDRISGVASLKVNVNKDEETGKFVLTPVIVVESEGASRPYMQGLVLNGSGGTVRLEGSENSGELVGITMHETSCIKLTAEALEALGAGGVQSIEMQGKNKSYDMEVSSDGGVLAAFAEICRGIVEE